MRAADAYTTGGYDGYTKAAGIYEGLGDLKKAIEVASNNDSIGGLEFTLKLCEKAGDDEKAKSLRFDLKKELDGIDTHTVEQVDVKYSRIEAIIHDIGEAERRDLRTRGKPSTPEIKGIGTLWKEYKKDLDSAPPLTKTTGKNKDALVIEKGADSYISPIRYPPMGLIERASFLIFGSSKRDAKSRSEAEKLYIDAAARYEKGGEYFAANQVYEKMADHALVRRTCLLERIASNCSKAGRPHAVLDSCKRFLKRVGPDPEILMWWAEKSEELGDFQGAVDKYRLADETTRKKYDGHDRAAALFRRLGDPPRNQRLFQLRRSVKKLMKLEGVLEKEKGK